MLIVIIAIVNRTLRSFIVVPRAPEPPKRSLWDWLLVLLLIGLGVLEGLFGQEEVTWHPAVLTLALLLPITLLWRRSHTLAAVVVGFGTVGILSVVWLLNDRTVILLDTLSVCGFILTYALLRWGSGKDAIVGLSVITATYVLANIGDPEMGLVEILVESILWIFFAALGATFRVRSDVRASVGNALRSVLWASRAPDPPKASVWDWLLALLLIGLGGIEALYSPELEVWKPIALFWAISLPIALVWRRSFPLESFGIVQGLVGAIIVLSLLTGNPGEWTGGAFVVSLILSYALGRWGSGKHVAIGVITILVMTGLDEASNWESAFNVVLGSGILIIPVATGTTMRYRADAFLRRVEEARMNEREQLARELHDTVAHHVSTIAIQAQAARVVASSQPEAATEALKVIEQTASSTLTEMRKIVGALRTATEVTTSPQQRIADIERLARNSAGDTRVDVSLSGKLDGLDPSVEVGLYRIAQESITNALRHANNVSRVEVRVEGSKESVCLTVLDDGDSPPSEDILAPGYGLTGMKERATLLGGRLEAGPHKDGGWLVRAELPNTGG